MLSVCFERASKKLSSSTGVRDAATEAASERVQEPRTPVSYPDPELGSPPRPSFGQSSPRHGAPPAVPPLAHSLGALGMVDAAFERNLPAPCMRRATGILLVQPPSSGRSQLASQLEGYGYAVHALPTTIEALELLSRRPSEWQLVLVDVLLLKRSPAVKGGSGASLSGTQGYTRSEVGACATTKAASSVASGSSLFHAQLQARKVGVPFVALGSRSQRAQLEEAVCHGAASSLLRPICGDDLAALWSLPLMHASLGEAAPEVRHADLAWRREATKSLSARIDRFWQAN